MIPEFPEFKKLELSDREEVQKFTSNFPPYSDFNFSNMWAWDLDEEMGLSMLNGNLVVKFSDYVNGEPFFSFLGDNMVNETAKELLNFSEKNYKIGNLKLIPEFIVNLLDKSEFQIEHDINSNDYIYLLEDLANMNKWSGTTSSKNIRGFCKLYDDYTVEVEGISEVLKNGYIGDYVDLFERWARSKNLENFAGLREYKAFERFLRINEDCIKVLSFRETRILVGFTMYEIFSDMYAISHFAKTDYFFNGKATDILNWEEAKMLHSQGVKYFNWEQDLGIEGLRKSKLKYKPIFFLNKYFVGRLH